MSAAGTPVTDEAYVGLAGSGTAAASLVGGGGGGAEGLWLLLYADPMVVLKERSGLVTRSASSCEL